jgi:hypothetical protein
VGTQANPTGTTPVVNVSPSFYQWKTSVDPFTTGQGGPTTFGLATISPNFRTAYVQNFNMNTRYQVSRNTILQLSYVGSLGRRLFDLIDINQAKLGSGLPNGTTTTATIQAGRPYFTNTSIANAKIISAINQVESEGTSNYNSAQVMLRTSNYHGLTAQASYTYGHALDVISGTRGLAPQNSSNLGGDYGSSDFNVRVQWPHCVRGTEVHDHLKLLTTGWQSNAFITAFTGHSSSGKAGFTRQQPDGRVPGPPKSHRESFVGPYATAIHADSGGRNALCAVVYRYRVCGVSARHVWNDAAELGAWTSFRDGGCRAGEEHLHTCRQDYFLTAVNVDG